MRLTWSSVMLDLDLDDRRSSPAAERNERLDRTGLELATDVRALLKGAKVRYCGEGWLKHLEQEGSQ